MTFLVDGTLGGTFPSWTTATRPASPAVGQMGYNTTTGNFDMYIAGAWTTNISSSTGVVLSSQMPTGSVLQVVSASYNTGASTTSSTFTATGLTASITPKFSTSKVLILVSQTGIITGAAGAGVGINLYRNSTIICSFSVLIGYMAGVTITALGTATSGNWLDSPATTSSVTYSTKYNSNNNSTNVSVQNNNDTSTITLMEIAG
jgi:hypothetical protein